MTKTNTPSPKRREEGVAKLTVNPFLDADFYARMRDYTERDAAIIKELKAIAEIRAGNKQPDPRNACLVLDLAANAPAHAMFAKAGIQNWRSLAADDCSVVRSEKATETSPLKVYAVFYLDPLPA